jgi:hypothetical protein
VAAEITVLRLVTSQATNLTVATDVTVFNSTPATINVASDVELSNAIPEEISSEVGSPGILTSVARADHVHSAANLIVNGGNF